MRKKFGLFFVALLVLSLILAACAPQEVVVTQESTGQIVSLIAGRRIKLSSGKPARSGGVKVGAPHLGACEIRAAQRCFVEVRIGEILRGEVPA